MIDIPFVWVKISLIVSLNINYKVNVLRNNSKFKGTNAKVGAFFVKQTKINMVFIDVCYNLLNSFKIAN